jgi:hypothetical protein
MMAIAYDDVILHHALNALVPKDNPARVATPTHREYSVPRRSFADLGKAEQRVVVDDWVSKQQDMSGWVVDQLSIIDTRKLMTHFVAGDDAEIGRMVAHLLLGLGCNVEKDEEYQL